MMKQLDPKEVERRIMDNDNDCKINVNRNTKFSHISASTSALSQVRVFLFKSSLEN
jgi:hypothetical protein